jgi:sarcosine oxidase delta subunit|tara:strand:+ start:887 stop:1252 length:366 start_codon:yes stop_codon:yes gene_type:complete
MARHEREFFNEKQELKPAMFTCPKCRHRAEYEVRWVRRLKKARPPQGADAHDHEMHQKLRDYMVRIDDMLSCQKCRRRFEVPSQQSVVFLDGESAQNVGGPDARRDARARRQPRGRRAGWV